jgi:hypothetical protein
LLYPKACSLPEHLSEEQARTFVLGLAAAKQ